jgi:hypothetical protein
MYLSLHHINGDRNNNHPTNKLNVCSDCHSVIHRGLKEGNNSRHQLRIRGYITRQDVVDKLRLYRQIWMSSKKEDINKDDDASEDNIQKETSQWTRDPKTGKRIREK